MLNIFRNININIIWEELIGLSFRNFGKEILTSSVLLILLTLGYVIDIPLFAIKSVELLKCLWGRKKNNKKVSNQKNNRGKTKRKTSDLWWNEKCERVVRIRKAKWLSLQYKFTREEFFEYKKVETQTKVILREEKKKAFLEFCETLNRNSKSSYVFNKIKQFNNKFSKPPSYEGNIEIIQSMKECIEDICSTDIKFNYPKMKLIHQNNHFLELPFGLSELTVALCVCVSNVNKNSAPGYDKINYKIIDSLPEFVKRTLLDIYNDVMYTGSFPEEWREYLCVFISKANNKVRPISMSSCLLKLFEKMINERLVWWLEHNQIINGSQYGFRMNRSSTDSLALLVTEIGKQFYKKSHLAALFLDIKGVYDNVLPEVLINKLIELKIPNSIIFFIYNLVSERHVHFINCPGNISRPTCKGLPQGSVLSPTLFTIYINSIDKHLIPEVKILKFADDIALYSADLQVEVSLNNLEKQVRRLSEVLSVKNLMLAPEKCKLVIFNRVNLKTDNYYIKIANSNIKASPYTKFLGMVLDKRLNWKSHINYITKKCEIPIRILNCIRRTWWGAAPLTMITLYNTMIRSRIEYGGFLISPCKENLFYKLEKIQLKCMRLAMGYRTSTPINIITSESKVPLIKYRFELLCYKFLLRCLARENLSMLNCLEETNNLSEHFIYENNFDKVTLVLKFEEVKSYENFIHKSSTPICYQLDFKYQFNNVKVDLLSGESIKEASDAEKKFQKIFQDRKSSNIFIFTDGSKTETDPNNQRVGMASWSSNENFIAKYKLFDLTSSFSAEATAISFIVEKIVSSDLDNFIIFSDSKSVLNVLQNIRKIKHQPQIIQEINQMLFIAKKKNKNVELVWIPSHRNICGNDKADELAKKAAREGPFLEKKLTYSDIFTIFKKKCFKENENSLITRANEQNKGTFFFQQYHIPSRRPWFYKSNMSRKSIVNFNRLRSGHNSLKSSLFRF